MAFRYFDFGYTLQLTSLIEPASFPQLSTYDEVSEPANDSCLNFVELEKSSSVK